MASGVQDRFGRYDNLKINRWSPDRTVGTRTMSEVS